MGAVGASGAAGAESAGGVRVEVKYRSMVVLDGADEWGEEVMLVELLVVELLELLLLGL